MEETSKTQKSIKQRIFSIIPLVSLIGLVIGAVGGYIYYIEIGCNSGSCAITSNPYMSIIWGAAIGYLIGDIFHRKPKAESKTSN